jgi:hypothetical protein
LGLGVAVAPPVHIEAAALREHPLRLLQYHPAVQRGLPLLVHTGARRRRPILHDPDRGDVRQAWTSSRSSSAPGRRPAADQTGTPEWLTVRTGLFGGKESFVPLADADLRGDDFVISTDKATVSGARRVDEDGHLSEEQETELYRYYGLTDSFATDDASDDGVDWRTDVAGPPGVDGQDTSGPTIDNAMTRSEEPLPGPLRNRHRSPSTPPHGGRLHRARSRGLSRGPLSGCLAGPA